MTRSAIMYILNNIDLKLYNILENKDEVPDFELTEDFLRRYNTVLFSISDKCQKLIQKYKKS